MKNYWIFRWKKKKSVDWFELFIISRDEANHFHEKMRISKEVETFAVFLKMIPTKF